MKQRKYFDCFGTVGKPSVPNPYYPYDEGTLVKDMMYAGVHGAAVIHNASMSYSYSYGNKLCLNLSDENDRIYPLSVVAVTAEIETGNKNYFRNLLEAGSVGLVVSGWQPLKCMLEPKGMKNIVEALEEFKKPLFVLGVQTAEIYDNIHRFACEYPQLPVIMQCTHWDTNRIFLEMMNKHDNLYFDLSQNHTNSILETTKNYFGIHRALYSSEWPLRSMGAIKSIIEYADLNEAEKDMVAHGNACRLFGISPDALALYDDSGRELDRIAKEADEGVPISEYVIDPHTHIVGNAETANRCVMLDSDYASVAKKMDRLGIDVTITSPLIGLCYDGTKGNEETLEAYKAMPERYLGYSVSNINYEGEVDKTIEMHRKYPDVFVGMKPYPPYQNFDLRTDKECARWFEYANEHALMALIHADLAKYAEQVDDVCDKYPDVTFILAHSGASFEIATRNAGIAKKHKNVILDITYTSTARGMIEYLVSEVGAERVVFATDMPMRDPAPQLGWVCYADISLEDKKKILGGNIISIISNIRK